MILKGVQVMRTRYFSGVNSFERKFIQFETVKEKGIFFDNIGSLNNEEVVTDFNEEELLRDEVTTIKELTFKCDSGYKRVYTLDTYYYMNDNGKTVETI